MVRDVLATVVVYAVCSTFAWPFVALALAPRLVARYGAPLVLGAALLYACVSYGGAPERRGGRIFHWANRWWPRLCHSYFPVELRVDVAALPERFVLALHPHGPYPLSASLLMPQLALLDDERLRRVRFAAASAVFFLPFVRDMYLSLGCIEASRRTLRSALADRGLSVAILPGGEQEQLLPTSAETEDVVEPRDGLFRLALETRTPLVPCFAFGERDAYTASTFGLDRRRGWVERYRVGIPCAWGRHRWFPCVPRRSPVKIVVGDALPRVDGEDVPALRRRYRRAVDALYEAHRTSPKALRWVAPPARGKKGA